ncbi:universal stress protein [Streptomyces mirabilis]|jgi:nucleotide-binding universal stress UspA family protein|uniref:Nucleotide-binding universal stress protein, UspA family n=1 Tax=Streptomyces mirabilis TaxID=68239 RepID=A0A1I2XGD5_9ACTN|nr:universal stress protein [Streptomyces mirabilis]SFH11736.1 Nucleotide-binding universal stress protein, UspA family [Streptomyces mirabilis]
MSNNATSAPRIVVGVDGSEPSKAALRLAVDQAELTGGVVDAICAWELPPSWYGLAPPADTKLADYQEQARKLLDRVIDEVLGPEHTVEIRPRSAQGHPAAVLLDAAARARLLVLGNRGHGGFAEALLGSVSQHCVQHAPCPVVVVRGPRHHET